MTRRKEEGLGRAQRRALATRVRLLDAARHLFCEKGVDFTTIAEITERADLGKGTFYRHFSGKDEVMTALVEDAVTSLLTHVRDASVEPQTLQDALHQILRAHTDFFTTRREEFLLLFQGRLLLKLDREDAADIEEPIAAYLASIEERIARFVPQGINPVRVRRLACALAGFVAGFLSFAMVGMTAEELETSLAPLRHAFVAGSSAFLTDRP